MSGDPLYAPWVRLLLECSCHMLIFVLPKKSKNRLGVGTGAEGLRHPSHQKQCQFRRFHGKKWKNQQNRSLLLCFFSDRFVWTCNQYPQFRCFIMAPFSAPRPQKPISCSTWKASSNSDLCWARCSWQGRMSPKVTASKVQLDSAGWVAGSSCNSSSRSWGIIWNNESYWAMPMWICSCSGTAATKILTVTLCCPFLCRTLCWHHFLSGDPASNTWLKRHSCSARCS